MKIKELQERYGLKARQSIYDWCEAAGVKLSSDEQGHKYASQDAIATLDKLHQHIKDGGTLKSFVKPIIPTIYKPDTVNDTVNYSVVDTALTNIDVLGELALALVQKHNPLRHHQLLREAAQEGWILTTSEVKKLIGIKPKGQDFIYGCWSFVRCGKVGRESGWTVEKI